MLLLYQFPISHYCEKARWALDYKQLEHRLVNLLPGPHFAKVRKIAPASSTPVLVDDDQTIQGSSEIISYLERAYPPRRLTPEDERAAELAAEWEEFLDREIGVHVRRICYHYLLDHPEIVVPFFTQGGPWYGALFYRFTFTRLRQKMREAMGIDEHNTELSKQRLRVAIDRLERHLESRDYIAGDDFSRADLTAASLLAPLHRPAKYGLAWPEHWPPEVAEQLDRFQNLRGWVEGLYANHR